MGCLWTLIRKELQLLLREPQTRAVLLVPVILQVLLFPFAARLDINNVSIGIYNADNGYHSHELIQRIASAEPFAHIYQLNDTSQIRSLIDSRNLLLVLHFPVNFSRNIERNQPVRVQLILDGRNSNSALIAENYITLIINQYQQEFLAGRYPVSNINNNAGNSELIIRNWYNPNLDNKWFVVPSLIALITTIGVMTVTSLSVARETEQGTLDQLRVSPLGIWQIFSGKAIPALIVAIIQATIVLLCGIWGYNIPFSGQLWLFYFAMLLYGLSLVGFGLLISTFCSTQQQAFIGVFVFIMPAILLSGYISPVENMPNWLQTLTWINPIQHFTEITKEIYLKNASLHVIWPHLWPLLVITVITGSAAFVLFRRKIA